MSNWKEILKVDLREARMLGRKHAPEEMAEGKKRIAYEKKIANAIIGMKRSDTYNFRRGRDLDKLKQILNYEGFKVDDIRVKPVKVRPEKKDSIFEDAYPEEDAIITIESRGQEFSFAFPPLAKDYGSVLRRPETKKVRGGHRQRHSKQHEWFDRKEDID
tara:strand:- start:196 stop:675 length:480 start_codon:yes stop_codon:yes gene_type:complete